MDLCCTIRPMKIFCGLSILLTCALAAIASNGAAQDAPVVTVEQKTSAAASIQKWSGFEGTWEGEIEYVSAPKEEWLKKRHRLKVVYRNGESKAYSQDGVREWVELAKSYRTLQPDPLTLVVNAYSAGGVWTESYAIFITRHEENEALVFVQRVVNNWVSSSITRDVAIFGDTRTGKVSRSPTTAVEQKR